MKITKEFAPVTIRFETQNEYEDFRLLLRAARDHYHSAINLFGAVTMKEKAALFLRDLEK